MQTIQFKVDNSYVDIVLNLLKTLNNLKLNVVRDLLVIDNSKKDDKWDIFFEQLEEIEKEHTVALSSIVVSELLYGAKKK